MSHGCNGCSGSIAIGDDYIRQRVVDGGDIWTWKAHLLCNEITLRISHQWMLDCTEPVSFDEVQAELLSIFGALAA